MRNIIFALIALVFIGGCNTAGKALENAGQKTIVSDGFFALNKITITDTATQSYTPQLFSMFLTGRYVSLLKNAQGLYYDKKSSASTFNSSAVTTEEYLIIQVRENGDLAAVIKELAALKEKQGE